MIRTVTRGPVPVTPPIITGQYIVNGIEEVGIAACPGLHNGQTGRGMGNEY